MINSSPLYWRVTKSWVLRNERNFSCRRPHENRPLCNHSYYSFSQMSKQVFRKLPEDKQWYVMGFPPVFPFVCLNIQPTLLWELLSSIHPTCPDPDPDPRLNLAIPKHTPFIPLDSEILKHLEHLWDMYAYFIYIWTLDGFVSTLCGESLGSRGSALSMWLRAKHKLLLSLAVVNEGLERWFSR